MGEAISTVGQLAGVCVWDDPDWIKVLGDSSGHIIVSLENVATTPTIYNKTMTLADTEYSQALPADTKKFTVKCRGEYDVQLCFTENGSDTTYITIPSQQSYWEDGILDASITLYFQCATAAQVLEIVAWS